MLRLEVAGGVATLTVNRPDKLNALNAQTLSEMEHAFEHCAKSESVRALIVTGAGEKAFVAGADIKELAQMTPLSAKELAYRGQQVLARVEHMGKTPLTLYLARPADVGAVAFREVAEQGYWTVDDLRSPVVELTRCYFDGKMLRSGRLFYETGYYGGDGAWVDKPKAFLAWAEALLGAARKALRREPRLDAYLGPEARELHDRNAVELVSM